jgi:hypothetical protein
MSKEKESSQLTLKLNDYFPKDISCIISSYLPLYTQIDSSYFEEYKNEYKNIFYITCFDNISSLFDTDKDIQSILKDNFFLAVKRNTKTSKTVKIMANTETSIEIQKDIQKFEEECKLKSYIVTKDLQIIKDLTDLLFSLKKNIRDTRNAEKRNAEKRNIECNLNIFVIN